MCTFKVFYTNLHRYVCIPAGFTPKIVLIQPISGATFLHAIIWGCWVTTRIYGSIPFSFLFLDTKSIVISSIPMRIHLHVLLTLYTSLFVIFGLFLSAQSMPLKIKRGENYTSNYIIYWDLYAVSQANYYLELYLNSEQWTYVYTNN